MLFGAFRCLESFRTNLTSWKYNNFLSPLSPEHYKTPPSNTLQSLTILIFLIMPSHKSPSAFIKLFCLNGAPWEWPAWQERTGIHHGLFPALDEHLPPGWTRQNAVDVHSYFTAYNQLTSETDRIRFATRTQGGSSYPGRAFWSSFVNGNYSRWGIHNLVVAELKEWDVHPMAIMIRENSTNDQWPNADFYVPKIIDSLALKLWGPEAFREGSEILSTDLRRCLQIFVQRAWTNLRGRMLALRGQQGKVEATAIAAFKGKAERNSYEFR